MHEGAMKTLEQIRMRGVAHEGPRGAAFSKAEGIRKRPRASSSMQPHAPPNITKRERQKEPIKKSQIL